MAKAMLLFVSSPRAKARGNIGFMMPGSERANEWIYGEIMPGIMLELLNGERSFLLPALSVGRKRICLQSLC